MRTDYSLLSRISQQPAAHDVPNSSCLLPYSLKEIAHYAHAPKPSPQTKTTLGPQRRNFSGSPQPQEPQGGRTSGSTVPGDARAHGLPENSQRTAKGHGSRIPVPKDIQRHGLFRNFCSQDWQGAKVMRESRLSRSFSPLSALAVSFFSASHNARYGKLLEGQKDGGGRHRSPVSRTALCLGGGALSPAAVSARSLCSGISGGIPGEMGRMATGWREGEISRGIR